MKKIARSLFTLIALVGITLVGCQGPSVESPVKDDTFALEGVITGKLTNRGGVPVVGAQVTLASGGVTSAALTLEPSAVDLVITNAAGEFAFDVEEEGEYALTTLLDNEGAYMRVTVVRGSDGDLTSAPVSLQSAPLGGVAGRIAGKGAGVWAYLLGTSFLASTDVDGEFVISSVPAGSYQLAPGLLGATGAPVPVRVAAGEVTTVVDPLTLGPVITSVEPAGFVSWSYDSETGKESPSEVRIMGSGFGATMGISQVRHAGLDLSDYVTSWADHEIVVENSWDSYGRTFTLEDLRFSVANATGEAHSELAGIVRGDSYTGGCGPLHSQDWIFIRPTVFGSYVSNAEVDLTIFNGTALNAPGGPPVNRLITNGDGCVEAYLEANQSARLPTVVQASFYGAALEPAVLANRAYMQLDDWQPAPGENTIRGELVHVDTGDPMSDDGHYTLSIPGCGTTLSHGVPLALDELGRFAVTFNLDSGAYCSYLFVHYRGAKVAQESINIALP